MNHKYSFLYALLASVAVSSIQADEAVPQPENIPTKVSKPIPVYENRINFNILRFGYERIKPESIYVGIEGWSLAKASFSTRAHMLLAQAEARLGYNFCFNKIDHLTPFVSAGYFREFHKNSEQGLSYGGLGLRYEHEFNKLLTLGVNTEGMVGGTVQKFERPWGDPIWGIDVALPLTFRFAKKRNWDYRFEPFLTSFYGQNSSHLFFGARSSFGYRF